MFWSSQITIFRTELLLYPLYEGNWDLGSWSSRPKAPPLMGGRPGQARKSPDPWGHAPESWDGLALSATHCKGHILWVTVTADGWPTSGPKSCTGGLQEHGAEQRNKASPFSQTEPGSVGDVKTRTYERETVHTPTHAATRPEQTGNPRAQEITFSCKVASTGQEK